MLLSESDATTSALIVGAIAGYASHVRYGNTSKGASDTMFVFSIFTAGIVSTARLAYAITKQALHKASL